MRAPHAYMTRVATKIGELGGAQEAEARVIRCRAWLMEDTRLNTQATRLTARLIRMLAVLMGNTQAGVETE